MTTISGNLKDILGAATATASLVVQLCGFGSLAPRVAGTALVAAVAPAMISPDAAGSYNFTVYGNDTITPAGSFYLVQVLDASNNVVAAAMYQFADGLTYDLSSAAPYLPPAAYGQTAALLVVVAFSGTPTFDCRLGLGLVAFEITLSGNVTLPLLANMAAGQVVTFVIVQDGGGGHDFHWPANVHDGALVDPDAGSVTIQSFLVRSNLELYPCGAAIYS